MYCDGYALRDLSSSSGPGDKCVCKLPRTPAFVASLLTNGCCLLYCYTDAILTDYSNVLDCSSSVFGCCPDQLTPASGWNLLGCPGIVRFCYRGMLVLYLLGFHTWVRPAKLLLAN